MLCHHFGFPTCLDGELQFPAPHGGPGLVLVNLFQQYHDVPDTINLVISQSFLKTDPSQKV